MCFKRLVSATCLFCSSNQSAHTNTVQDHNRDWAQQRKSAYLNSDTSYSLVCSALWYELLAFSSFFSAVKLVGTINHLVDIILERFCATHE